MALLEVKDLRTSFRTDDGVVKAVDGVNFTVEKGQTLGIVGESGSGKSVTCLSIMGLNPRQNTMTAGQALWKGRDLLTMSSNDLRQIRGDEIAMIFQDPMTSLNPVHKIGQQLAEAVRLHQNVTKKQALARALELLKAVGIPRADQRMDDYPHQFSGGMRQRAMIAMSLVNNPDLLIADEPTTALDVTTQAQILALMEKLQDEFGSAIIMITHDLGVVAEIADEVLVMYAAEIIERGSRRPDLQAPAAPVHMGPARLAAAARHRRRPARADPGPAAVAAQPAERLPLPSALPVRDGRVQARPSGARADGRRARPPAGVLARPGDEGPAGRARARRDHGRGRVSDNGAAAAASAATSCSSSRTSKKHFPITQGIIFQKEIASVKAVDGVSFTVREGETLGVVGESGCGKSTMARCIMRLLDPTAGRITFRGTDITKLSRAQMRPFRRELMMIFQDPYASLNPRKRVGFIVAEALEVHKLGTPAEIKRRVQELLEVVGLNPEHYNRFPHEFSGGQRQRIGVARALAVNPKLIVCDEPVSALDVSVQAQILNLLKDLQRDFGLTYIFIAHDLNVVRHISDRVMVMYLGKLVETASRAELYAAPKHPTRARSSRPCRCRTPTLGRARQRIVLEGDVPSPINPPSACRFHPRCPRFVEGHCDVEEPLLTQLGGTQYAACHYPLEHWPMTEAEMRRGRSARSPRPRPKRLSPSPRARWSARGLRAASPGARSSGSRRRAASSRCSPGSRRCGRRARGLGRLVLHRRVRADARARRLEPGADEERRGRRLGSRLDARAQASLGEPRRAGGVDQRLGGARRARPRPDRARRGRRSAASTFLIIHFGN